MAQHNDFGRRGELCAKNYLLAHGYKVLDTNWTSGKNELDIVARKDDLLVVIEVKSRSTAHFEHPSDAVTDAKIRRIVEATNDYLFAKNIDLEVRFDIISVLPQGNGFAVEHIEDAFLPPIS